METRNDDTPDQRATLIVEQYGGVYPAYEAFYIQSIIYAAERSESAFRQFDDASTEGGDAAQIVATVQEALTHAGALSRFFWPVKKDSPLAAARGRRLREAFTLDAASPLRWRKLRNAFEHFDEDLDRFLLAYRVGYFFPGPLVDDHELADDALGHIFKLVDPARRICVLLGEKFEFQPIRQEVRSVLDRAMKMDERGGRLESPRS